MAAKANTKATSADQPAKRGKVCRRVFILGAGASAPCGIAVAKDILRESVVRLAKKDSAKSDRIHSVLRYLYPNFDEELLNYPNIEDFLNSLEMAKRFDSKEFIGSTLWPNGSSTPGRSRK